MIYTKLSQWHQSHCWLIVKFRPISIFHVLRITWWHNYDKTFFYLYIIKNSTPSCIYEDLNAKRNPIIIGIFRLPEITKCESKFIISGLDKERPRDRRNNLILWNLSSLFLRTVVRKTNKSNFHFWLVRSFFASQHYVQCLDNLSSCNTKTPVVDYFETRFTTELYLECRHKVKDRKYWKLAIVLHVRCVNVKKNLCFHNNDLLFG